jgi:tetratricopeptide (TPR) repeat protein
MELKKIILYVLLPATVIFGPFFALSNGAIGCYQESIDKNPNTESAKNWQLRLAGICSRTLRYEMAASMYGKFADRYKEDPRRPEALWLKAKMHENAEQKKDAIDTLLKLCREHKDHALGKEADQKLNRQYQYFPR